MSTRFSSYPTVMYLDAGSYEIHDRATFRDLTVYFKALVIHNRPCQSELRVVSWVGKNSEITISDHAVARAISNWAAARGLYFDVAAFTGYGSDKILERAIAKYRRRFRGVH